MWKKGTLNGFEYWVKHYDEDSQHGIGFGKISKLLLKRNGEIVCSYDRGYDMNPASPEAAEVFEELCRRYN